MRPSLLMVYLRSGTKDPLRITQRIGASIFPLQDSLTVLAVLDSLVVAFFRLIDVDALAGTFPCEAVRNLWGIRFRW